MKVEELSVQNFKGASFDTKLSGREIFVGPNGSGKSTYLEALTLLLSGYLPKVGKTADSILQVSTGDHLLVLGSLEGGSTFSRIYKRAKTKHKDGSVTHKTRTEHHSSRAHGAQNDEERKKAIVDEVGSFSIMFDLDEFLGMSDTRKRDFVFGLSSPEKLGWDKAKAFEGIAEAHHGWVQERWRDNVNVVDNLASMVDIFTREALDLKAVVRSLAKSHDSLLEEKQTAQMEEHEDPQVLDGQLKELRGQKTEIEKEMAGAQVMGTTRQSLIAKRSALEGELIAVEEVADKLPDIEAAKTAVEQAKRHEEAIRQEVEELKAAVLTATSDAKEKEELWNKADDSSDACAKAILECDTKIHTINEVVLPLLHEIMGPDAVEQDLLNGMLDKLGDTQDSFRKQAQDLQSTLDGHHAEARRSTHDAWRAAYEMRDSLSDSRAQKTRALQLKEADLNKLRFEAKDAQRRNEEHANALVNLRKAKGENQTILDGTAAPVGLGAADVLLRTMTTQIDALEERLRKARRAQHLEHQFQECVAKIAEAEETMESTVGLAKALGPKGLQSKIMKDVVGPIRKKVNELLKSHGYKIEFNLFDRNGKEVFEIFKVENSIKIPYLTLSGGEKILFGAALVVALIQLADPPVKALCIEAAELDANSFGFLVKALDDVAGGLDNVMLASCNERVTDMAATQGMYKGWRVHDMGTPVEL